MTALSGEATRTIPASIEIVWGLLTDVEQVAAWSPECSGIEWLGKASAPALGARFRGRNKWGPASWSTTCTIATWDPPHCFEYVARHWSGAATRWSYLLAGRPEGTHVIEQYQTEGSPRWVIGLDRLLGRPDRLALGMSTTLDELALEAIRREHPSVTGALDEAGRRAHGSRQRDGTPRD